MAGPSAMQLSDIRTLVRYNINESSASFWSDSELNSHILNAYHQIMGALRVTKNATGTVALNQQTFNVPADFGSFIALFINNQPVALTEPRALGFTGNTFTDPTVANNDSGQPLAVFASGEDASQNPVWTLYPIPDKQYNYSLYYVIADSGLAADTSIPLFRNDWHWILSYYATAMAWAKNGRMPEMFASYMRLWEDAKADAIFALVESRTQNYVTRFVDARPPTIKSVQQDPLSISGI